MQTVSGDMDARVGRLVHQMMWDRHLTQTAVANQLGITQPALSKKLRGDRGWSAQEIVTVAQVLATSSSYLLGETSDPRPPSGSGPDGGEKLPRLDSNQQHSGWPGSHADVIRLPLAS